MKKKPARHDVPYCPDTEKYVLVRTRTKNYWRKRRGTYKKAALNSAFAKNALLAGQAAPAALRIRKALDHYLVDLHPGYLNLHMANALRKGLKLEGGFNLKWLMGLEMQERHPLGKLLRSGFKVNIHNGILRTSIELDRSCVKRHSKLATHYYFEIVLLYGDLTCPEIG